METPIVAGLKTAWEKSWAPWLIIGVVVASFIGVIAAKSPRQTVITKVTRDSAKPKNATADSVIPQTQETAPNMEPALDVEHLRPFPAYALDKVRLSFDANIRPIKTYMRGSGQFSGLESRVYAYDEGTLPRSEIVGRETQVYAYEKAFDIDDEKIWSEIPLPEMEPVPLLVITSLLDVKNLSGYGFSDMGAAKLLAFTATVRVLMKKAKSGKRDTVSVGSTTLVFSRNKGELRVLYVPTTTWETMRLSQL